MILYPAIDLKDGQCVRVLHGDLDTATVFNNSPAAQLDGDRDRLEDRLDGLLIHGLALHRAVQVDDVDPMEAGFHEAGRLGGGRIVEHLSLIHI